VYVTDDADVAALRERWGSHLTFNQKHHDRNKELDGATAAAEARNELPSVMTPMRVQYLIPAFYGYTARYFDRMSSRIGFDDVVAEALAIHDADWAKAKGDKYGPRAEDGNLRPEALEGLAAFADWVRNDAPLALADRIAAMEFSNPEFTSILNGPKTTPAPAL
jgi:hypothetical protein